MPIPEPKEKESEADFMQRCLSEEEMKKEYPNIDQRYAVCINKWLNKKQKK